MARLKRGIGSMLSGKADGMVFVQLDGETYMRTAPRRTKSSWTPKQLLHRKRFREVTSFCNQFQFSLIPQIWKLAGKKLNGRNLFLKTNMPAFAMDGSLADPKMLRFSTGKLPLPQQLKAERTAVESTTIAVSWNNDPYLDPQRLTDHLMAISAGNGNYSYLTSTGLVRGAMNGSFELPPHPIGATHLYMFLHPLTRMIIRQVYVLRYEKGRKGDGASIISVQNQPTLTIQRSRNSLNKEQG